MDENKAYELIRDVFGDPVSPVRKKQYKIICINPECGDRSGNLEINLERLIFHCFSGETTIITFDGIEHIENLVGKTVKLLTKNGEWVDAPILYFGEQLVHKVVLKRDRQEKVFYATSLHRWFTRGYKRIRPLKYLPHNNEALKEVTTDELKPGDFLAYSFPKKPILNFESMDSNYWIARGFVFGDGTRNRKQRKSVAYFSFPKDEIMLSYFSGFTSKVWTGKKRCQKGSLPYDFKDLPPKDSKIEELYCWLKGYFAADGCVKKHGAATIASANLANLKYIKNICLKLGIGTFEITKQFRKGYNKEPSNLYSLSFVHSDLDEDFFLLPHHKIRFISIKLKYQRVGWRVKFVESAEEVRKVYCAIVPKTHSFTLDGFILTGNCWRCNYSGSLRELLKDYLGNVPEEFNEEWYSKGDAKKFRSDYSPKLREDTRFATLPEDFVPLWEGQKLSFIGQKALKYVLSRMTKAEVEKYKVGYCGLGKYQYRIIVPTFEEGKVVYFVARDFIGDSPKRYLNPDLVECSGISSGEVVFNLDRCRELGRVVMVEGVFDAIRTGEDAAALFKSAISEIQFNKLFGIPNKYVMLDSPLKDPNAPAKAVAIADEFAAYGKPIHIVIPPEGDPGESDRKDIREWIVNTPIYTIQQRRLLASLYPGIPRYAKNS